MSCSRISPYKCALSLFVWALLPSSLAAQVDGRRPNRHFEYVIIVILENQGIRAVLTDPYIQQLTKEAAWFSNYNAITHPSFPNYLALVAGSTFGIEDDDTNKVLPGPSIADRLEEKGLKWKSYAENYPGSCFLGHSSGSGRVTPTSPRMALYARKHVPLLSFENIQNDAKRCARVVNDQEFWRDVKLGRLPHYAFYTPNMLNNGHDSSLGYSTRWLRGFLDRLKHSSNLEGALVVVTWDEGGEADHGGNHILTLLLGPEVNPGEYDDDVTHYSLLRSIENNFGLTPMHSGDRNANSLPHRVWKH